MKLQRTLALLLALLLLLSGCAPRQKPQAAPEPVTQFQIIQDPAPTENPAPQPAPENETQGAAPETQQPAEPQPEASEAQEPAPELTQPETPDEPQLDEDAYYYEKDQVAAYIHQFGHLPDNYITKKEAQKLGWTGGSLKGYADDKCIGGDRFGNREGLLPEKQGRVYYECDIDTLGKKKRGAKRIIYSNDGLIYYTDDHYESFTLLYGEE